MYTSSTRGRHSDQKIRPEQVPAALEEEDTKKQAEVSWLTACFSTSGSDSALETRGVLWAVAYGVSSIAITLFNKSVLSSYDFHYPLTLTVVQSLVTLVSLMALKYSGALTIPDFSWSVARRVAPLSAVFIFYVVVSLAALGNVNVPMFTALRRTTILFVMAEEYLIDGRIPSKMVLYSTAVMALGAVVAAAKDLTYDPWSYTLVFLTNLSTSLYTVNISHVKKTSGLSIFGMLFYNNILTLPPLILVTWATGEFQEVQTFAYLLSPGFQMVFAGSALLAFGMNMCTYYSTSLNSPTTQSVVGQLKNFVAFLLSLVMFSDYIFEPINFMGLLIGFGGGVWYAYIKYGENQASRQEKEQRESEKARDEEQGVRGDDRILPERSLPMPGDGEGRHDTEQTPAVLDVPTYRGPSAAVSRQPQQ